MSTFKESDSFVSVQVLVQYLVFITMYVLIFVIKKTPLLFSFLGQSSLIHFRPSLIYFSSKTVGLCTRLTPFIHPSFHILDASSTVFNTFLPELNHCEIIILKVVTYVYTTQYAYAIIFFRTKLIHNIKHR